MKYFNLFKLFIIISFTFCNFSAKSQLADSCKLTFGMNLGGLSDWSSELPFVDMMKNCREWYTKDFNNPNGSSWNTDLANKLKYRDSDGYPTHIPQTVAGANYQQIVATVWGWTSGWETGQYVVLFDGNGSLGFWGGCITNVQRTSANRYTFDFEFNSTNGYVAEMRIEGSDSTNPVRNIRIIRTCYENTYQTQPFNPHWISKLRPFKMVRFMDWGQTNNWGTPTWPPPPKLYDWSERSKFNNYTWGHDKGIPYEMMIKLLNDYDLDGWVCVPHNASNDYIQNMAQMFYNQLKPDRKIVVEYSNEIWNWGFTQAKWCEIYGSQTVTWPERIVPYIQNCLDIWTNVYGQNSNRLIRTVALQTGWLDVSQRIAFNLRKGSFDVVSPAFYFGIHDENLEAELDALGDKATVADVATRVRASIENYEKPWMRNVKTMLADSLKLPMMFYEGGQHITPTPFGQEPTYKKALEDIQRDTAIYNLYNEWFNFVRTLQSGDKPLQCMHFSFISGISARYGSWGVLESIYQDTNQIAAPKYKALLENIHPGCDCNNANTPSAISIKRTNNAAEHTNADTVMFTLTLSQNANYTPAINDITVTNGNLITNNPISGSGTEWTIKVATNESSGYNTEKIVLLELSTTSKLKAVANMIAESYNVRKKFIAKANFVAPSNTNVSLADTGKIVFDEDGIIINTEISPIVIIIGGNEKAKIKDCTIKDVEPNDHKTELIFTYLDITNATTYMLSISENSFIDMWGNLSGKLNEEIKFNTVKAFVKSIERLQPVLEKTNTDTLIFKLTLEKVVNYTPEKGDFSFENCNLSQNKDMINGSGSEWQIKVLTNADNSYDSAKLVTINLLPEGNLYSVKSFVPQSYSVRKKFICKAVLTNPYGDSVELSGTDGKIILDEKDILLNNTPATLILTGGLGTISDLKILDEEKSTSLLFSYSGLDNATQYTLEFANNALKDAWGNLSSNLVLSSNIFTTRKKVGINPDLTTTVLSNQPNPFSHTTFITWYSPVAANTKISIFDESGHLLSILLDEYRVAGENSFLFNSKGFDAGIYYYQIQIDSKILAKKMMIVR